MAKEINMAEAWRQEANCLGEPTEIFFPPRGKSLDLARQICGECTVRKECLDFAQVHYESIGIWGGLSNRQRIGLRHEARLNESG
jgi:WhiB family redox-sensing transcriptional regulator